MATRRKPVDSVIVGPVGRSQVTFVTSFPRPLFPDPNEPPPDGKEPPFDADDAFWIAHLPSEESLAATPAQSERGPAPARPRIIGCMAGTGEIVGDLDAPLPWRAQ